MSDEAIVSAVAFGLALYEFHLSQKWKKSEFAATQLNLIHSDPEIAFCCLCLDYSTRRVFTPEKYKVFTDEPSFIHNYKDLIVGLKPEEDASMFNWPQIIYRDSFDRFFSYLGDINHYLSIGLFRIKDVYNLKYWLEQLANPRFIIDQGERTIFIQFAQAYNYNGFFELMNKFGINCLGPTKPRLEWLFLS